MQQDLIRSAGAPEHREPTATKRDRVETLLCGDCFVRIVGPDAANEMRAHKESSEGRCK